MADTTILMVTGDELAAEDQAHAKCALASTPWAQST